MRKIARRALTAGAVAATAAALTTMPASADPATNFDVQNGGTIAGSNVGSIIGFGLINGSTLECTSSTASGSLPSGTARPGTGIATLSSVTFSSPGQTNDWCVANGSIPTRVTALGTPWSFNADDDGPGSDSGPGGTTGGRLTGVQVELYGPSVGCTATVGGPNGNDGYIEGTYTNPSSLTGNDGTLSVAFGASNNLEVLTASSPGCNGLVDVGETVSLAGTYSVVNSSGVSPTID
ncbi:hypothetical protein [Actinomadura geliboluensis]|uniref:hypothetical protein n=1 Tax=Actinomadura geliboluensis TaxID=882440 RepID=UPI00262DD81C|nr:hypothetical protein [Actinomadura geliboluensis]